MAMTDSTAEFFEGLGRRGHEPLLEKARGIVRFDLVDGKRTDRWFVALDKGDVSVSRRNRAADCVVRADRRLFEAMARGQANAMAAYLRGELTLEGDPELLVLVQRVLPGPTPRRARRASTGRGRDRR
jgi:predicted lipid carrier protein YhbT